LDMLRARVMAQVREARGVAAWPSQSGTFICTARGAAILKPYTQEQTCTWLCQSILTPARWA
jgi:hypothetical protein